MSSDFGITGDGKNSWAEFQMDAFDTASSSEKDGDAPFVSNEGEEAGDDPGFTGFGSQGRTEDDSAFAGFGIEGRAGDDFRFASIHGESAENNEFTTFEERAGDLPYKRKADDILKKAEDVFKSAKEKAALAEREAYEKGFAQGEKDGIELGEKKAAKVLENIEKLLVEISRLRTEILKQCEKEVLEIIFSVAKKIIHHQLETDEKAINETLHHAVALAAEKNKITLNVNPEDFDYVEKLRPTLFARFKDLKSMTVTSDPSITRGGCLLETPYGDVDARIETQFEMIHKSLEGAYMENGDD